MTALAQSKILDRVACITHSYTDYPSGREEGPKKCNAGLTERKSPNTQANRENTEQLHILYKIFFTDNFPCRCTITKATSSCYTQPRQHAAFGHYIIDNDPRVRPRGLSRAGHAVAGYVVVRPLATSTRHLHLRWHTASAYIIGNDPQVRPWGLSRASHAVAGYVVGLPVGIS